jgi:type IV pilus assembly protein PilC
MHPRAKARFYHDLGQMIHSGVSFQNAVEKLTRHARGATAKTLAGLREALKSGMTVPEALAAQSDVSDLEMSLFSACARAGRLDTGLAQAAEYYGMVAQAKSKMWTRMGYPLFVLHFGVVAYNVINSFKGGFDAVVNGVIAGVAVLWAGILLAGLVVAFIVRQGGKNPAVDRALGWIPIIGKMRSSFALSRFCSAYDLQLEAGVNVFSALESSSRASGSAVIVEAGERALPAVRAGEQVGSALADTRAFPDPFIQTFLVGEETGRLPKELRQLSDDYRVAGFQRLEMLSEWIPRLLYVSIMILIGWHIVLFYQGYYKMTEDIMR